MPRSPKKTSSTSSSSRSPEKKSPKKTPPKKTPPKKKKSPKKKTTTSHPPYKQMITEAIFEDKKWRQGTSRPVIFKYVQNTYDIDEEQIRQHLTTALRRMIAEGTLEKVRGSYKLASHWKSEWLGEQGKKTAKKRGRKVTKKKKARKKIRMRRRGRSRRICFFR